MGKIRVALLVLAAFGLLSGCISKEKQEEKLKDLDFTVAASDEIPEEFLAQIEEEKEAPFHLTYMDQGYLYIAVGYGKQDTSGYSIRVKELSESESKLRFLTELVGPGADEKVIEADTFPWLVVKLEEIDKAVEFQ